MRNIGDLARRVELRDIPAKIGNNLELSSGAHAGPIKQLEGISCQGAQIDAGCERQIQFSVKRYGNTAVERNGGTPRLTIEDDLQRRAGSSIIWPTTLMGMAVVPV